MFLIGRLRLWEFALSHYRGIHHDYTLAGVAPPVDLDDMRCRNMGVAQGETEYRPVSNEISVISLRNGLYKSAVFVLAAIFWAALVALCLALITTIKTLNRGRYE